MLDNKTKERIAQAAKNPNPKFWGNDYEHDAFEKGYIAGAEAEATRAAGLVECLQGIKASCEATGSKYWQRDHIINDILKQVRTALSNYNNPK